MLVGETNQTCGSSLQFFQRIFCIANIQKFVKFSNVFESYCRKSFNTFSLFQTPHNNSQLCTPNQSTNSNS